MKAHGQLNVVAVLPPVQKLMVPIAQDTP